MSIASPNDVAVHLGRELSTAETARATVLLVAVEALITARIPDLVAKTQGDKPEIPADLVKLVEAQAVARVIRNPDGSYQESLAGEYMQTRDRLGADGVLRIADDEWVLLLPAVEGDDKAFTIFAGMVPKGRP